MQPPAFLAFDRAAHDQIGSGDQVAQFDQVIADAEIRVELVYLAREQPDAVLGTLQRLVVRTMPRSPT